MFKEEPRVPTERRDYTVRGRERLTRETKREIKSERQSEKCSM
jgi:hypothetical protein